MLALQQPPRMGSSQPDSDLFLPFGYSVDQSQDGLLDAPDPAGAPLLSETDTKLLSSFFDDMSSAQYNMPSFGEGLHFSDAWFDLPPQLMGTATSFGQQVSGMNGPDVTGFMADQIDFNGSILSGTHARRPSSASIPQPPQHRQLYHNQHQHQHQHQHHQHQHHSDDVLNAAATLLQRSTSPRSNGKSKELSTDIRRPLGPSMGHLRHQPMDEFNEESQRDLEADQHSNTFTHWMFGSDGHSSPVRKTQVNELQWGSDANFATSQVYVPAPNKDSVEGHHQVQVQILDCLEPSQGVVNNGSSSPTAQARQQLAQQQQQQQQQRLAQAEDADAPPRKRRKGRLQKGGTEEEDEEDSRHQQQQQHQRHQTAPPPKSKSPQQGNGLPSPPAESSAGGSRRRKPGGGGASSKGPRENLSEEQKRENHIRSEQKRRTLIKEGFDDLCHLVPGLRGGGFSKSTMLTMAAEWLEQLLKGNESLAAQLAGMGQ